MPCSHADGKPETRECKERNRVEGSRRVVEERELAVELCHGGRRLGLADCLPSTHLSTRLALGPLEPVAAVDEVLDLGADDEPVEQVGEQAGDDENALHALLDLVPVRRLERGREEHGVEVEVREEQRAGEERRRGKVRGLERRLQLRKRLARQRAVLLVPGLWLGAEATLTMPCQTFVPSAVPQVRR